MGRSDAEAIGHNSMPFCVAATQSIRCPSRCLPDVVLDRTSQQYRLSVPRTVIVLGGGPLDQPKPAYAGLACNWSWARRRAPVSWLDKVMTKTWTVEGTRVAA